MKRIFILIVVLGAIALPLLLLPTLSDVPGCIRADVWPSEVIWLHVLSDAGITLAYTAIPLSLVLLLRQRRDIPLDWIVLCFAAFIVFCGGTHLMGVITIWKPVYWLSGEVKAWTAGISLLTAVLLQWRVVPVLRGLPSPELLRQKNEALKGAVAERDAALTEAMQAAAALRDQLALVERQGQTIRGLSTPVLHVARRTVLMPLIGVLDSDRTAQATDALLIEISRTAVAFVVLDLTGVEMIDTATAAHLLKMISAARLLGAEVVLTGIQPAVAATMVDLGIDLQGVRTFRTLGDGIEAYMRKP
jgi:anti-anti-sigma regulatory factor